MGDITHNEHQIEVCSSSLRSSFYEVFINTNNFFVLNYLEELNKHHYLVNEKQDVFIEF